MIVYLLLLNNYFFSKLLYTLLSFDISMSKKWIFLTFGMVILLSIGYYLLSPLWRVIEVDQALPVDTSKGTPVTLAQGNFIPSAHEVSGRALLLENDGKKILRFEDFDTVNGPDLRIYLSTDTTTKDFIDLGEIKATKGNVNYEVPADVDTKKYSTVLVWCKAFTVLFSSAKLE